MMTSELPETILRESHEHAPLYRHARENTSTCKQDEPRANSESPVTHSVVQAPNSFAHDSAEYIRILLDTMKPDVNINNHQFHQKKMGPPPLKSLWGSGGVVEGLWKAFVLKVFYDRPCEKALKGLARPSKGIWTAVILRRLKGIVRPFQGILKTCTYLLKAFGRPWQGL